MNDSDKLKMIGIVRRLQNNFHEYNLDGEDFEQAYKEIEDE